MSDDKIAASILKNYLDFVKLRAATTNFRAEEKLKSIDQLAEIVFCARESYRKKATEKITAPKN